MDKAPGFEANEYRWWLRDQPRDVALSVAARAALRVAPLLVGIHRRDKWDAARLAWDTVFPLLRGQALSLISSGYQGKRREPFGDYFSAANKAAAAANAFAENASSAKLAAAAHAAAAAAQANAGSRSYTANANGALNAAIAAHRASADAVVADRTRLIGDLTVGEFAFSPLWPYGEMPDDLRKDWEGLKSALLSLDEDWDVWTDWYEARLEGAEANEALEVARVTLPEALWQQGPKAVNGEIRHLIELSQKGGDEAVHARMADLRRQYPDEGGEKGRAQQTIKPPPEDEPAGGENADRTRSGERDRVKVWVYLHGVEDSVMEEMSGAGPGTFISCKLGEKPPADIRDGDPILYWRKVTRENRWGLVGTGFVSDSEPVHDVELNFARILTEVEDWFEETPFRDQLISEFNLPANWPGYRAISEVSPGIADQIDSFLRRHGRTGIFNIPQPAATDRHETDFVSDRPETARDLLARAPLAFALAAHINRIWSAQVSDEEVKGRLRRCLDACHLRRLSRAPRRADEAAFILHIDAPWGGGKTTFANFLARILNPHGHGLDPAEADQSEDALLKDLPLDDARYWPEAFKKRRWYVVNFNAWQHEHVAPPWWNFYEAIRRQCARAILFEPGRDPHPPEGLVRFGRALDWIWPESLRPRGWLLRLPKWLWFWARELSWRIFRPAMRNTVLVLVIVGLVGYWAMHTDWFATLLAAGGTPSETEKAVFKALFGVAATGGVGYFLLNAFRSGLQAVVESAGASADAARFGESDPLERFREHFSWFVEQLDEPVLVVVDDLDRCEPKYVVELVRGMLTFFRSPRVVFLLLGDKDWIETAFAKVHKDMAEVHRDSQITFGGRFAEKAIQLSFILPEADPASRNAYLTALLAPDEPSGAKKPVSEEAVSELKAFESEVRTSFAGTDRVAEQNAAFETEKSRLDERFKEGGSKERQELRRAAEAILNREAMLRAATARSAEAEIRRHALEPLKAFLPPNPRRIKRIVNMIGAYQASARSAEGVEPLSDQWRQLVLWTVVMSEYPNVWRTLVVYPALAARIIAGVGEADENGHVALKSPGEKATERERSNYTLLSRALGEPNLVRLMRGNPFAGDGKRGPKPPALDADALQWLRRLTPLD